MPMGHQIPAHKIPQNTQLMFGGTAFDISNVHRLFSVRARQEIRNFPDWDFLARKTDIVVRAAINVRKFEGDPDIPVPAEGSHAIVQGRFDGFHLEPLSKWVLYLNIIVESFEVLKCGTSCPSVPAPASLRLPTTSASPLRIDDDWDDSDYDVNTSSSPLR